MSDVKAGGAYVLVQARDELTKQLNAMETRFKAFGSGIGAIGKRVAAVGGVMAAGFFGAAKSFANVGGKLTDLSAQTKISVESLSALGYAAKQAGLDLSTVVVAVRGMQRLLYDAGQGGKESAETLEALGLSLGQLQGLSVEEKFSKISAALASIDDDTTQAALAMKVFGKSGLQVLSMLGTVAKDIKRAKDLKLIISKEDAENADALGDALDTLGAAVQRITNEVGAALAPTITELTEQILPMAKSLGDWARANQPLVQSLAAASLAVAGLGTAMTVLEPTISAVGSMIGTLPIALAVLTNPIGLVTVALGTATAAFLAFTDTGQATARQFGQGIAAGFSSAAGQLQTAMDDVAEELRRGQVENAAKLAFAHLEVIFQEGWARLKAMTYEGGVATAAGWVQSFLDFMDTPLPVLLHGEAGIHEDNRAAWEEQKRQRAEQWKSIADLNRAGMANAIAAALDDPAIKAARQRLEELRSGIKTANAQADAALAAATPAPTTTGVPKSIMDKLYPSLKAEADRAKMAGMALPDGASSSAVPNFGSMFTGVAEDLKEAVKPRDEAIGTFSGAIAEQLIGADGMEERQVKAAESTAKNTKKIAAAMQPGILLG